MINAQYRFAMESDRNLPKLMGGGANRLFYLKHGNKYLLVKNVNLTGGQPLDTAPTWGAVQLPRGLCRDKFCYLWQRGPFGWGGRAICWRVCRIHPGDF
jgi:hypothetical protein